MSSINEFKMVYSPVIFKCGQWLQNDTDCDGAKTATEYKIRMRMSGVNV